MKLSHEALVEAPASFCFDCLARLEDAPKYLSMVKELKMLTPDGLHPGARWRQTLESFGRRLKLEAQAMEVTPPRGYSFQTSHRGVVMTMGFRLTPKGPGQPLISLDLEGKGSTMVGKIALASSAAFLKPKIDSLALKELRGLKAAIEREARLMGIAA